MDTSTAAPRGRRDLAVIALGLAGLVVSWAFFSVWIAGNGLDFWRFWSQALWAGDPAGLVWDLVFSGAIVTAVALRWRAALGGKGVAAVLLTTWVLGVCGGLAVLVVLAGPRPSR